MNDLFLLAPVLIVTLTGIIVLVMDLFRSPEASGGTHLAWLSALGFAAASAAAIRMWPGSQAPVEGWMSALSVNAFTLFFWILLPLIAAFSVLTATGFDRENNLDHGEFYSFHAFALAGMMVMVAAVELFSLFLGLETMALAVYALVAMRRTSARGAEASIKYFITGSLASALLLYGMVLFWGETGTLRLDELGRVLSAGQCGPILYAAAGLVLVGFGFKIAAVPFHLWTPDAYQGAPTPVTGFMAAAVKAASFAALLRVVFVAMLPELFARSFTFVDLAIAVAVLTMTVGNLLAMHQEDVKRMLAYSSISHAGYLLTGLALVPQLGSGDASLRFVNGAVLFYLATYGLATLLAFGVLARLGRGGDESTTLERLAGLATRRPGLAALLSLALLSLAGFPPTAGFFAKFALLRELVVVGRGKLTILVVIALVNALFSVYYYLRPMVAMYMRKAEGEEPEEIVSPTSSFALILAALGVLVLGLFPGRLVGVSDQAARTVSYKVARGLNDGSLGALAPFAAVQSETDPKGVGASAAVQTGSGDDAVGGR
ncbi:MAG: NADH-quinone oxidoreductase subunit N [Deltaproteobacteria bacterium]|nr:NADH-quinone oxidoreductase subunit N [Deltaproteobacteria bacterium]